MNDKKICTTNDYEKFKKLEGNRTVMPSRVAIIKNSIQRVGYVTNPIIVNEKYEIIEGQGRFEALRELKMPIDYIVEVGCGIEHCIALNMRNTNWKMSDFINSYADRGFDGYIKMRNLMKMYDSYNLSVFATAVKLNFKFDCKQLKEGNLEISEEEYKNAIDRLDWLNEISTYCNTSSGELTFLYQSLILCREFEGIDLDKLKERVITQKEVMLPFSSIPDCMQSLEQVYNKNRAEINKVYIFTEYRKWIAKNKAALTARIKQNRFRNNAYRKLA